MKNQHSLILHKFDHHYDRNKAANVISPAFEWAQSLENIFINIKFAPRLKTPGCLDLFDDKIAFEEQSFNMTINCRNVRNIVIKALYRTS